MCEVVPKFDMKLIQVPEINVPVVEWRSNKRDSRGIALIGTEYLNKNVCRQLYADGSIYKKEGSSSVLEDEKIDIEILKKAVIDYQKKHKVTEISKLLEVQKKLRDNGE